MRLLFLLPANAISGGVFVVFEHARRLQARGHEVTLAFADIASNKNISIYPGMEDVETVYLTEIAQERVFDIALATWWETAYLIHKVTAKHYGYFVQARESYFYSQESIFPLLVQHSYNAGFHVLTISRSLSKYLSSWLGYEPAVIPNAVESEVFASSVPILPPASGFRRVLVEGVPRSHVKRTELALEVLEHFPELEVVLLSQCDKPDGKYSVSHTFEAIPYSHVPPIYRSCDFILKLSREESFARPVLEMFAAGGTAVVAEFAGHEEYILHDHNALTVPVNDKDAAIKAVARLIGEPGLMARLSREASATARTRCLGQSNDLLADELDQIFASEITKHRPLEELWSSFTAAGGIRQYESTLEKMQNQCESLVAENTSLRNTIEKITCSYSYQLGNKIAKPLRHVRKLLNLY